MGRVMKEVVAKVKSRADAGLISKIVKEELAKIESVGKEQDAKNQ
jgi:Glu-tRNA(Gln) amidotransferase subunit E-like FAD-binding protein